ncbi:MAG: hypothetical protein U0074_02775 [Kouleothrix sp.]
MGWILLRAAQGETGWAKRHGCPAGRKGVGGAELVHTLDADMLMEATLVNLKDGQPGLGTVRAALERGMSVVLANKGPLALAYPELAAWVIWPPIIPCILPEPRPALRFSACVGGAL